MSARCDDCGRIVPAHEVREGPYATGDGRWHCLACITDVEARVERWWPELKGTVATEGPLSLDEILHRLGLQP
jgi:hypothetical protein